MPKDLFKELTSLYDGLETLIKQLDRALKNAPPGGFTERIWSLQRKLYRRKDAPVKRDQGAEDRE